MAHRAPPVRDERKLLRTFVSRFLQLPVRDERKLLRFLQLPRSKLRTFARSFASCDIKRKFAQTFALQNLSGDNSKRGEASAIKPNTSYIPKQSGMLAWYDNGTVRQYGLTTTLRRKATTTQRGRFNFIKDKK